MDSNISGEVWGDEKVIPEPILEEKVEPLNLFDEIILLRDLHQVLKDKYKTNRQVALGNAIVEIESALKSLDQVDQVLISCHINILDYGKSGNNKISTAEQKA